MATYAWVITQDLDNPFDEDPDGFDIPSRVGLSGPAAASEQDILRALNTGKFFQLVDDDGHPYYIGRCVREPADCLSGAGGTRKCGRRG